LFNIVVSEKKLVADFVEKNIDDFSGRGFGEYSAIGVRNDGDIIAGVVYHNWDPNARVIEMSAAAISSKWLLSGVLHRIFEYPFKEIDCQMVVLRVSEKNKRMRSIAKRFGFDEIRIPRLRGCEEDEMIYTLTKEQWQNSPFER